MKTLIVSDLHYDYNSHNLGIDFEYGFENKLNEVDLVLIAGDISGDFVRTSLFLDKLKQKITGNTIVACVSGNHLGYNRIKSGYDNTKENAIFTLRQVYNEKPVYFLENHVLELGEYAIIGCCLYTDFKLYNNQELSKQTAEYYINDFNYVQIMDYDLGIIRYVNSDDYIKWHKHSVDFIEQACQKYKDKKIILLTHFLVTPQSISKKYVNNNLNPFYCTNLEWLFDKYDNIELVVSGHSHEPSDIKIGNTRIILEPYGYFLREQDILPEEWFGKIIEV